VEHDDLAPHHVSIREPKQPVDKLQLREWVTFAYYLESKISFPFRARCVAANAVSPLRKGETTEVLRMAAEDGTSVNTWRLIWPIVMRARR
jgi:hypothetical protein